MLEPLTLPTSLPELRGPRVLLRGDRPTDVEERLAWPIDPEEEDGYGGEWRRQWHGETHLTRERLLRGSGTQEAPDRREMTELNWKVECQGRLIGACGLRSIDAGNRRATYTIGFFVPSSRGVGLGREATGLVLAYAFTVLGLHRVELVVMAGNHRAVRCYEACGFIREGLRRAWELYPDGWRDAIDMAILADDWQASHPPHD